MGLRVTALAVILAAATAASVSSKEQQVSPAAPPVAPVRFGAVRPITPPSTPLASESETAGITKFSFIGYGDTRCDCTQQGVDARTYAGGKPEVQPAHEAVVNAILAKTEALAGTDYPVRFILQSGDAVWRGTDAERWPAFTANVERLTLGAGVPLFFVPGNHDVTPAPASDPSHTLGLHNMLTAFSRLNPPEGSPRRLSGYAAFAVAYGNVFAVGLDSNIADDRLQLAWVADQLERVDRARFKHIVAFFHHPAYTSGRYSGVSSTATLPGGASASSTTVQTQSMAIRNLYMPLFRKHHVRVLIVGHDHLFDHWVERYVDASGSHRLDHIIAGGGGAPTYVYTGEPDLTQYIADGAAERLRVEHLAKPGATVAENPHHFLLFTVDGDKLSVEVVGVRPFAPYGGRSRIDLN